MKKRQQELALYLFALFWAIALAFYYYSNYLSQARYFNVLTSLVSSVLGALK